MNRLRFAVSSGRYAVVRLPSTAEVPPGVLHSPFSSVTRTSAELSLVCSEEAMPPGSVAERGWALMSLVGPFPFSMVGVLASVLVPLAAGGVSIFALSTYDTDHVLVKAEDLRTAIAALTAAGHELVEPIAPAER